MKKSDYPLALRRGNIAGTLSLYLWYSGSSPHLDSALLSSMGIPLTLVSSR